MTTILNIKNDTANMPVSFLNQLQINNPILYGNLYRSTLDLDKKLELLNECFNSKSHENLETLNEILKNNYEVAKIKFRNTQFHKYYTQLNNKN